MGVNCGVARRDDGMDGVEREWSGLIVKNCGWRRHVADRGRRRKAFREPDGSMWFQWPQVTAEYGTHYEEVREGYL